MAFSRSNKADMVPPPEDLTAQMVGIGMNFAAHLRADADIEATLVHASACGMVDGDLRVLSVLTTWLGVHHAHVNADRLVRFVAAYPSERVRAYWSAVATWLRKDRRLDRLASAYRGAPVDVLPVGTDFQIKRRGQDEHFASSTLRVPRGTLRDREEDVLSPEALVRRHAGYRNACSWARRDERTCGPCSSTRRTRASQRSLTACPAPSPPRGRPPRTSGCCGPRPKERHDP